MRHSEISDVVPETRNWHWGASRPKFMALALGPMPLASKVQALALGPMPWRRRSRCWACFENCTDNYTSWRSKI